MKMEKNKFRIGELAEQVGVERFVIRFWEKEFGLNASRSDGGQRFYTEHDLSIFMNIKKLLYEQGFTISGAKKQLSHSHFVGAQQVKETEPKNEQFAHKTEWDQEELLSHIVTLKKQLSKLRKLL